MMHLTKLTAHYFPYLENLIASFENRGYELVEVRESRWYEKGNYTAIMIKK